jgi:hypothetical protein
MHTNSRNTQGDRGTTLKLLNIHMHALVLTSCCYTHEIPNSLGNTTTTPNNFASLRRVYGKFIGNRKAPNPFFNAYFIRAINQITSNIFK